MLLKGGWESTISKNSKRLEIGKDSHKKGVQAVVYKNDEPKPLVPAEVKKCYSKDSAKAKCEYA